MKRKRTLRKSVWARNVALRSSSKDPYIRHGLGKFFVGKMLVLGWSLMSGRRTSALIIPETSYHFNPRAKLQKNRFSCRNMHFSAKKMHFPTENVLSCRRVPFPAEKTQFPAEKCGFGEAHGRKLQEIAGGLQGSRIKNAGELSQDLFLHFWVKIEVQKKRSGLWKYTWKSQASLYQTSATRLDRAQLASFGFLRPWGCDNCYRGFKIVLIYCTSERRGEEARAGWRGLLNQLGNRFATPTPTCKAKIWTKIRAITVDFPFLSAILDMLDNIFWDLALGSKLLRRDSEMTLPRGSVSDLPFSLRKSWELVCLSTARSLLQALPRRLSQNPSSDRSRSQFFAANALSNVCSYFCLVCGGLGFLAHFWSTKLWTCSWPPLTCWLGQSPGKMAIDAAECDDLLCIYAPHSSSLENIKDSSLFANP